jgi:hypothetical protein
VLSNIGVSTPKEGAPSWPLKSLAELETVETWIDVKENFDSQVILNNTLIID